MTKLRKATIDQTENQLAPNGNKKDTRLLHATAQKADAIKGLGKKIPINYKKGLRPINDDNNDPSGNQGGGVGFGGMDGGYSDFDGYDAEGDHDSGGSGKNGKPERNTVKKSKRAKGRK
jgi:hypothetical protein